MSIRMGALFVTVLVFTATVSGQGTLGSELLGTEWKITPSFTTGVRPDEPIEFQLDRPIPPAAGRLAIIIGHTDWSGLFEPSDRGVIYRPTSVLLPAGEHDVRAYLVSASNEWRPLGHFRLQVVSGGASPRAELSPVLDVANKGQLTEGHRPSTNAPPRATFQDFTVNAGMRSRMVRGGWTTESEINLLGVSNRSEAVRFGQQAAPLVDLVDYRLSAENHRVALSIGHVAFGTNRHLFNNFASRGVLASFRFGSRADLALSALHGSSIVGWDHFLGVERRQHRVFGATLGLEMLPGRPGGLRLEASLLDGRLLPLTNFNEGRINDAEQSHGGGLHVVASDVRQRFRLDGGYARSNFVNPSDPLLTQGEDVVPVGEESRNARYLDVSYALLQAKRIGSLQANLVATYRHEQVDPLYGSVMADLKPDVRQNALDLNGNIGPATVQLSYTRARDNLDEIASIVKTLTRITQMNAAVPLAFVAGRAETGDTWWPSLTYSLNQIHQRGAGVPVDSGFSSAAQIPDQIATDQTLSVEWQRGIVRASYRVNRTYQDNRQPGKEDSDLANLVHGATIDLTPGSRVNLQVDLTFEGAENKELARTDVTRRLGLSGAWRLTSRTAVSGLISTTALHDKARTSTGRDTDMSLEFSQTVPLFTHPFGNPQGQFFIRYARLSLRRFDRLFTLDDRQHSWTLNTGFNISLF